MDEATERARPLLAQAEERAGLSDFGDDWFLGPLDAWARDLESDDLSDFGRTFLTNLVTRDLVRRLRVIDTLRRHPEILDVRLPPIVYITGLERSGTTLLHNLVALHRDARALLRWELMEPVPPPTAALYHSDPRIDRVQASVDKLRGTLLERMHWVNADEPEECPWGFVDCVGMLGQAAGMCMPTWNRFLSSRDLGPAFRSYRRVIQLLLWRNPVPEGGFLVLKAPQIARQIDSFAAVFPEARFLITDRDPFRAMTSMLVMVESIVDPFCRVNPLSNDARRSRVGMSHLHDRLPVLTAFSDSQPGRTVHLGYSDLVQRPESSVLSALGRLGVVADDGLAGHIGSFLLEQRQGRRTKPPTSLPTLGYDHDDVLADPLVADYCQRWDVEPERSRLTG